jgi:hypothetical protein
LIAANCGCVEAVNCIKEVMTEGNATRDHYIQALQGYTLYLDEIRSDQRDKAMAFLDTL